jgi:serine/threonine protein kinase/tetratricopeptide (TPR) repeat protein
MGKHFKLVRRLGHGGFGDVYEATDLRDQGRVALKVLRDAKPQSIERFKREFRTMQGISHPNLVRLDELFFDEEGPAWFFTMELVDGTDLMSFVRRAAPAIPDESPQDRGEPVSTVSTARDANAVVGAIGASFDETRLRDSLRQLLDALIVLHGAGMVHRDIKPSNVMATPDGRIVLLDFGLVLDRFGETTTSGFLGTPAYMAPEQAGFNFEVSPAADIYAVGVLLYHLMTGRLPFEGRDLQFVLMGNRTLAPPPPQTVAKAVPEDLAQLCLQMLRLEASQRPTAVEAKHLLLDAQPAPSVGPRSSSIPDLVGRQAELDRLRAAFEATTRGELATVIVTGESGIGKSALLRHFMRELRGRRGDVTLLEGRCYERESVPYKTIDAIVDALSRRLSHMPAHEVAQLLPTRNTALAQVFPVMLRLEAVAREHAVFAKNGDPSELRQLAFSALRELFTRIALRGPTVVAIDDLQWADDDGLRALDEILRPPDPPPLLVIGVLRSGEGSDAARERLRQSGFASSTVLELGGLSLDEGRALAARLLGPQQGLLDPTRIATESAGHPLFVEELARHALTGTVGTDRLHLDAAIRSRIDLLPPQARRTAEFVALAGRPLAHEILARSTGSTVTELKQHIAVLRSGSLVRTSGGRWGDAVEPYHDRIREAAVAELGSEVRREMHEALALAIEGTATTADPEALATHWKEAGRPVRAAEYAAAAGAQALKAFAFDRAARWYEQALSLLPQGSDDHLALRVLLGEALAGAGRGALAAAHFEAAAAQASPVDALQLRRRAADQLLRSGRIDEGIALLRTVLAAMGIAMTEGPNATLASLVFYRVRLTLRGLRFSVREEADVDAGMLRRIDALWSVAAGLSVVDVVRSANFHTRGLLLALDAGEPDRLSRALAMEAAMRGIEGGPSRARSPELLEMADQLARRNARPETEAWIALASSAIAMHTGRFEESLRFASEAEALFRERCEGPTWKVADARAFGLWSLAYLGRLGELARRIPALLRDAVERDDLFAQISVGLGPTHVAWLARDDTATMRQTCADAMHRWTQAGFHFQHLCALFSLTSADLYEGDAAAASARVEAGWASVRRSLQLRTQFVRIDCWYLRGRTAVSLAFADPKAHAGAVPRASGAAARIEGENMGWSQGLAHALRAAIAQIGGDTREAVRLLELGERAFVAASMRMHAASCAYQRALLTGAGDPAKGEALLREEGVRDLARFANVLVPMRRIEPLAVRTRT